MPCRCHGCAQHKNCEKGLAEVGQISVPRIHCLGARLSLSGRATTDRLSPRRMACAFPKQENQGYLMQQLRRLSATLGVLTESGAISESDWSKIDRILADNLTKVAGNFISGKPRVTQINYTPYFSPQEKMRARAAVKEAVRRKKIRKPMHCSRCGTETAKSDLHGHHEDYSKPLEVEWLCAECHSLAHTGNLNNRAA